MTSKKNVLFVYSRIPSFTNAVRDYVNAFGRHSAHCIHYFDADSGPLVLDLARYDAIIFNYCFWARRSSLTPELIARVAVYDGSKIAIFQDEQDTIRWHRHHIVQMNICAIVTVVDREVWQAALPADFYARLTFLRALTGYLPEPESFSAVIPVPMAQRSWWISYRGRPVPYQYGRLTRDKSIIGERMRAICSERGIPSNIEISEEGRLYGTAWHDLIRNSRVMLGTESGTDVFDFDGGLWEQVDQWLALHPQASFEEVEERFLTNIKKFAANQISPRLFEAIALRTGLLLFEGEYSGVLTPWSHYIPLKKDFSNLDEVLAVVQDIPAIDAMVERTWRDVVLSGRYSFSAYVARVDALIDSLRGPVRGVTPVWGLLGWRDDADMPVSIVATQPIQLPTTTPLRHFDQISDTVLRIQFNSGALHRALMSYYEAILYSAYGQRVRAFLKRNSLVYAIVRKCVRLLTGRW